MTIENQILDSKDFQIIFDVVALVALCNRVALRRKSCQWFASSAQATEADWWNVAPCQTSSRVGANFPAQGYELNPCKADSAASPWLAASTISAAMMDLLSMKYTR